MELHEIKNNKGIINKIKRYPREWEKIFESYSSEKGLITRMYKQLNKIKQQKNK